MSLKDRNPRLGRGLAALLGDAAAPSGAAEHDVRMLPIETLRPGAFQPRKAMGEEGLESLAASIRATGMLQPILVRPDRDAADAYEIVAGERRWRAAQRAGMHTVPCLVRRLGDADAMAAGLVENLQRQDLNAVEEAEGYRRLGQEFGLQQDEVAQVVGKSRSHVANTMRLLALPVTVLAQLQNGALTAGHARALLAHPEPQKAALQVMTRGLNVRQTEALVQALGKKRPSAAHRGDTETLAFARELSGRLGLKVTIQHGAKGGHVRIDYADLDQLDGLVALLTPR